MYKVILGGFGVIYVELIFKMLKGMKDIEKTVNDIEEKML